MNGRKDSQRYLHLDIAAAALVSVTPSAVNAVPARVEQARKAERRLLAAS